MALHHWWIDLAQSDDIPEEGVALSSHSLTWMQEKVLPWKSITSDIALISNSFTPKNQSYVNSPFAWQSFEQQKF